MQTDPITMRRKLRKLSATLKAHGMHDINSGGCGVMAGIVGEILESLGVPVEVVTSSAHGCSPAEARWNIEENDYCWDDAEWDIEADERWDTSAWDSAGLSRAHLAVRFMLGGDMYSWDSDGLIKSDKYFGLWPDCGEPSHVADYPFGDGMTVRECIEISSTDDGWNSTFDRRQIPLMRKLAQQCLLS